MNNFIAIHFILFLFAMQSVISFQPFRMKATQHRDVTIVRVMEGEGMVVPSDGGSNVEILRKIDTWACVANCGACCKLGPLSSRPDLAEYLSPDDLSTYKSMVGDDDWCVNFDKKTRKCTIYQTRPDFCRVSLSTFKRMYDIDKDDFNDFCTFCCREQITDVYGEDSKEMSDFEDVLIDLSIESRTEVETDSE